MIEQSGSLSEEQSHILREFRLQLRWRLYVAAACCLLDILFFFFGGGTTSQTILMGYLPYMLLVGGLLLVVRQPAMQQRRLLPLMTAVFLTDFLFIALQMHWSGGGWWHGASFFMLVILLAASTVPPRTMTVVALLGLAVYLGKGWLEISGVLTPPLWSTFPRVDGNFKFFWNYASFGVLVIGGSAIAQARLVGRIRRLQRRHRAILDASPYLVLTLDRSGVINAASRIAEEVTGQPAATLLGTRFQALLDRSEQARATEALARADAGERLRLELQGAFRDDAGRWYVAGFSRLESGRARDAVVVLLQDTTLERAQQAENARLARELEDARRLELVGRLVSGVAHELNNPLAAILALTEQLEQETSREQVVADSKVIHEQARRARAIVRDLLQVVRSPTPARRSTADVRDVVTRVISGLSTRPERSNVEVVVSLPAHHCWVVIEEGSAEQVVTNLVVNALQATATEGRVDVIVEADSNEVRIVVSDTGAGLTEDVKSRIFEPFFTTRPPGHGTGLGLSVSRAIVERHGGTLTAESQAIGARFQVSLPRSRRDLDLEITGDFTLPGHGAPALTTPPQAVEAIMVAAGTDAEAAELLIGETIPALPKRRVLLVDDEGAIRSAISRWFVKQQWHVEECADGAIALERLVERAELFDLILCDLKMPGVSGIDLYHALAHTRPGLLNRLIFATGDVASPEVADFLASVQVPVLEKPFALSQLAALTDVVLRSADVRLAV